MIQNIQNIVSKLQAYKNRSFPIVSLYLTNDDLINKQNSASIYRNKFEKLVKDDLRRAKASLIQEDLNYIDAYLLNYQDKNESKSIAIFSGGNNLWEVINLEDHLSDSIVVRHSPNLRPLIETQGFYRRYLVILADRNITKYFTIHMKQIGSYGEFKGKDILQKLKRFIKDKRITGVILGGNRQILENIKKDFPKDLKDKIISEFTTSLDVNMNDIWAKIEKIISHSDKDLNSKQILY